MSATTQTRARATSRRSLRREEGAVLVEFALVLPLLLLIVIGTMWFGRAINYWIDGNHLANVGARWATVDKNPGPGGSLQESIRMQAETEELRSGGTSTVPSPVEVCIAFPDGSSNVGDPVEATVSVDYNWMPLLSTTLGVGVTKLSGTATMRLERVPNDYSAGCS